MNATKVLEYSIALFYFFLLCLSIFNQHLYTHADVVYVDSNDPTVNTYEVVELTNSNFDTYIKSSSSDGNNDRNRWLVMFTSPDCGYCAKLKTEVSYTMSKLEARKSTLRLGNVDATVEKELKERFKIDGYPTIYYFENGEPLQQYTLQRTEAAILKFDARTSSSNPVYVAQSLKDIEQYCYASNDARVLSEEPVTFVLVTSNRNENDSSGINDAASFAFQKVAKKKRSFYFFAQINESPEIKEKFIRDAFNNLKPPYIVRVERGYKNRYYPPASAIENQHVSIVNETAIDAWVKLNNPPTLAKLSALNYYQITHAGRKLAMMIVSSSDSSMQVRNRMAVERFEECARKYSGPDHLYFGVLTDTDNSMAPFIAQFVVDFRALPRVIVIDADNGFFYEDQEIETNQGKCAVVLAALEGKIPYQREGLMGYPWRGYKLFIRFYPYSMMIAVGFFFLVGFFYYVCVISTGSDDEDEDDIGPNPNTIQEGSKESKPAAESSEKKSSASKGKKDRNKKHKD